MAISDILDSYRRSILGHGDAASRNIAQANETRSSGWEALRESIRGFGDSMAKRRGEDRAKREAQKERDFTAEQDQKKEDFLRDERLETQDYDTQTTADTRAYAETLKNKDFQRLQDETPVIAAMNRTEAEKDSAVNLKIQEELEKMRTRIANGNYDFSLPAPWDGEGAEMYLGSEAKHSSWQTLYSDWKADKRLDLSLAAGGGSGGRTAKGVVMADMIEDIEEYLKDEAHFYYEADTIAGIPRDAAIMIIRNQLDNKYGIEQGTTDYVDVMNYFDKIIAKEMADKVAEGGGTDSFDYSGKSVNPRAPKEPPGTFVRKLSDDILVRGVSASLKGMADSFKKAWRGFLDTAKDANTNDAIDKIINYVKNDAINDAKRALAALNDYGIIVPNKLVDDLRTLIDSGESGEYVEFVKGDASGGTIDISDSRPPEVEMMNNVTEVLGSPAAVDTTSGSGLLQKTNRPTSKDVIDLIDAIRASGKYGRGEEEFLLYSKLRAPSMLGIDLDPLYERLWGMYGKVNAQ